VSRPDPWAIRAWITHNGRYLLGGGLVTTSVFESTAAIWTSGDGADWGSRVDLEGALIEDFATLPNGTLIAWGASEISPDDVGPVWSSVDGVIWTPISQIGQCCVEELVSTPDGVVGVGWDAGGTSGDAGLVATSRDGRSWSLTRGLRGTQLGVVYTARFGIVITGRDPDGRPAVIIGWPFER
jgi:hypothetical protein